MSEHTPGPWVLDGDLLITKADPFQENCFGRFSSGYSFSESEREANESLVLAAPDLLEALIAIETAYSQVTNWEYAGSTDRNPELARLVAIAARAAIARAKGNQP